MPQSSNIDFTPIHNAFQNKQTDLCKLQDKAGFSKYILIRTLDNTQLKALHDLHNLTLPAGTAKVTYKSIFDSRITIEQIKNFIHAQYPAIKTARVEQEEHLPSIIGEFGTVTCGVRNDNLNDVAKSLVRDKAIASYSELQERLTNITENTIRGYIEWQYYNQATNDLIEHFFNDHEKVIPTLRKITYVDFVLESEANLIPFDLKITHISDDYFDLLSKGLIPSTNGHDDYEIGDNESEIETIKNFYKSHKRTYNLPNYGGLKKSELVQNLEENLPPDIFLPFSTQLFQNRLELINQTQNDLKKLEWWNYKFQGERLFKNNNRFFIFLVYNNNLDDARPLKGRVETIGQAIINKLDNITLRSLNQVNYTYEKDASVNGDYTATSCSILIRADF